MDIKFGPAFVPFERRLQTTSVVFFLFLFFFGFGIVGLGALTYLLLYTKYYWISFMYMQWYYYDYKSENKGGRRNSFMCNLKVWQYLRDYFPAKLIKTSDLDTSKNYLFGVSPHGVMCTGAFINLATEATGFAHMFPGCSINWVTLNGQFTVPFHREFISMTGGCAASEKNIKYILNNEGRCQKKGQICCVAIGGAAESLESHPGKYKLVLKNRKGFARIALQTGASLVPVFSFGENDLYNSIENPEDSMIRRFQEKAKQVFNIGLPIFWGRGIFNNSFGMLPYRVPINTVIGKPIDVIKVDNPTQEQIDELHSKYLFELTELFNENKIKYCNNQNIQLEL